MTEMKRLLDEAISADAAAVLRSANGDGPATPEAALARNLAAFDALPSSTFKPSAPPGRKIISVVRAGAWGALAAAVALGGVAALESPATTPSKASNASSSGPNATMSSAVTLPTPLSTAEGIRVEDLPTAAPAERPPTRRPPSRAEAPSPSSIEDELAMIDAARGALASGQADAALTRVRGYQGRFRDGHFIEEADALEIQALAAMGRHEEAQANGARFLRSRPGSPYERRVRSAMAFEEGKP